MTEPLEPNAPTNAREQPLDARAFGARIAAWDDDLRGVAWAVVRTQTATDDVMQDAYERAFKARHTFDGRSSMKTWLHSIVYRTAIDYVRREGRRSADPLDGLLHAPATDSASSPTDDALARAELDAVLDACTPEQSAMLLLTAGLGYSFDETAEILGINRGTVASRVSRLRSRLTRWDDD
ncbi:MAG: RNA polymerase sigma factor [Actinomycetota bacterium]